jgi:hypothetical protein
MNKRKNVRVNVGKNHAHADVMGEHAHVKKGSVRANVNVGRPARADAHVAKSKE